MCGIPAQKQKVNFQYVF
jgi:hypothetical protein